MGSTKDFTTSPESTELGMKSRFQNGNAKPISKDRNTPVLHHNINNNEDVRCETTEIHYDEESDENDWHLLATVIDRIGMIIYIAGFSICTVTFLSKFVYHFEK